MGAGYLESGMDGPRVELPIETSQGGATRNDQQEQHAGLQIPDNPRMKRAGEPEMPGGESGVPAPAKNLAREGLRPGRSVSASGAADHANASTEGARLADSVPVVPVPEWAIGERWLIWLCSDPECGAYTVDGSKEGCICHVDPVATVEIEVVPATETARLRAELAECYRMSGADPDGDSDEMLAAHAVEAVRRMRTEGDAAGAEELALREQAEAERDRYREALREIAEGGEWPTFPEFAVKTARAALRPDESLLNSGRGK